jgi:hypothetical protein
MADAGRIEDVGTETPRRAAATALVGLLAFALTSAADGAAHTIDVVVVYPLPAEQQMVRIVQWQRNWGETEMGAFLAANFARVNQIYQQSGVDVEFDVVHHEQVDFSAIDPVNWKATLSLALMQSELGLAAHAPYLATIEAIRDLHAGDIVIYWRDFQDGGPVSNGAGSVGGGEDEAYVQLTYGGVNPPVSAHETGHLLGGQHSSGVQGTATFSIDGDAPILREYRTVMTSAIPLGIGPHQYVGRFSTVGASVLGDIDCSQFSGKLATCSFNPVASLGDASHDAVAVLAAMAPTVAAFREAAPALPAAGPAARLLLVMLMGAAGLAAVARRR